MNIKIFLKILKKSLLSRNIILNPIQEIPLILLSQLNRNILIQKKIIDWFRWWICIEMFIKEFWEIKNFEYKLELQLVFIKHVFEKARRVPFSLKSRVENYID